MSMRYGNEGGIRMNEQLQHYENKLKYEIDSWDLKVSVESGENIIVIDARSQESFQDEDIPNAINIPHKKMNQDSTKDIDKNAFIVTYCDGIGCNASTKGARNMLELGFKVKELIGGLDWWKRDGHLTHGKKSVSNTEVKSCGCG